MIYDFSTYTYNGYIVPMEFWKPITQEMLPTVKPIYWISNIGNVYNSETGVSIIRTNLSESEYVRITLQSIYNTPLYASIHRLVCMAFNGMPTNESNIVDHLNCNRSCNYEENLEWVNSGENNSRTIKRGRSNSIGEDCYRSILTNDEVEYICEMLSNGIPIKDIEMTISEQIKPRIYPALHSGIHSILNRESWKEISNKYVFHDYNRALFTLDEVELICKYLEQGKSYSEIIILLDRNDCDKYTKDRLKNAISGIRNGYHYKEISSNYNITKGNKLSLTDDELEFVCKNIAMGQDPKNILQSMNRGSERSVRLAVFDIKRGKCHKSKVESYKNSK